VPTYLTADQLSRDLALRDLTDPNGGAHAVQLLVDRAADALVTAWGVVNEEVRSASAVVVVGHPGGSQRRATRRSRSRLLRRHGRRSRVAGSAPSPHRGHRRQRSALCVPWRQPRRGRCARRSGFVAVPARPTTDHAAAAHPRPVRRPRSNRRSRVASAACPHAESPCASGLAAAPRLVPAVRSHDKVNEPTEVHRRSNLVAGRRRPRTSARARRPTHYGKPGASARPMLTPSRALRLVGRGSR
jgi:hypothetical protein